MVATAIEKSFQNSKHKFQNLHEYLLKLKLIVCLGNTRFYNIQLLFKGSKKCALKDHFKQIKLSEIYFRGNSLILVSCGQSNKLLSVDFNKIWMVF